MEGTQTVGAHIILLALAVVSPFDDQNAAASNFAFTAVTVRTLTPHCALSELSETWRVSNMVASFSVDSALLIELFYSSF